MATKLETLQELIKAAKKEMEAVLQENADLRAQTQLHTELAEPGLPPCPFCGDTVLFVVSTPRFPGCPPEWDGSMAFSIHCRSCAAEGGWEKSVTGARDKWAMCGAPGDRPTPYHLVRERAEQELQSKLKAAEERAEKCAEALKAQCNWPLCETNCGILSRQPNCQIRDALADVLPTK